MSPKALDMLRSTAQDQSLALKAKARTRQVFQEPLLWNHALVQTSNIQVIAREALGTTDAGDLNWI